MTPASSLRTATTGNSFPIEKLRLFTISPFDSAAALSIRQIAPMDQMIQTARSGKQNIVEGSKASGTSKETEIKLMGVARASLEELLADYCDFLRVRDLSIWEKESREARFVRRLGSKPDVTYEDFREFCETRPSAVVANIGICLIHQTNYLLDQQIRRLERDFLEEGGLRERMTRARQKNRNGASLIGN